MQGAQQSGHLEQPRQLLRLRQEPDSLRRERRPGQVERHELDPLLAGDRPPLVGDDLLRHLDLAECELEPESCPARELTEVHDALADFPAEKRKIGGSAELAALPRRWLPARKWEPEARELVPMRLRPATSFEWKSSPYRVTDVVDPSTEYTGLDYLVAYWLYDALCRARPDCPPR